MAVLQVEFINMLRQNVLSTEQWVVTEWHRADVYFQQIAILQTNVSRLNYIFILEVADCCLKSQEVLGCSVLWMRYLP
jgi:hypothetical protein